MLGVFFKKFFLMKTEQNIRIFIPNGVTAHNHPAVRIDADVKRIVVLTDLTNKDISMSIKDSSNNEISKMQNLNAYRSRNVVFENDGKPIELEGQRDYLFSFSANVAMAATTLDVLLMF